MAAIFLDFNLEILHMENGDRCGYLTLKIYGLTPNITTWKHYVIRI